MTVLVVLSLVVSVAALAVAVAVARRTPRRAGDVEALPEDVVGLRQDLMIRREETGKSRAALAGVDSQIAKLQSEFRATALDALTEAEANYRLRSEEVKKADDKAALTVLTRPDLCAAPLRATPRCAGRRRTDSPRRRCPRIGRAARCWKSEQSLAWHE